MATGTGEQFFARRSFGYGRLPTGEVRDLDRGQVISLGGYPNDKKLVEMRYFEALPAGVDPVECGTCGARFIDDACRTGHGNLRHRRRAMSPQEEDRFLEQRERLESDLAPLGREVITVQ